MSLGVELKRLRTEKEISLSSAAKEIGITKQYLWYLEEGHRKSISFEVAINIANFYEIPLDYLKTLIHEEGPSLPLQDLAEWYKMNEEISHKITILRPKRRKTADTSTTTN